MLDGIELAGLTTLEINDRVDAFITEDLQARPASKGQYGYAFALNASINQVVCHGVPSRNDVLRDGDIVNLDITLEKGGYIADSSKTYMVGAYAINNLDSSGAIASTLIELQLAKLGIDYMQRRAGYIESVTLQDVKAVAKKLLSPDPAIMILGPAGKDGGAG